MPELAKVGPWAKEKLDALGRYLDFYTKVLKNQPWRTIYFDGYAGGGRAVLRTQLRQETSDPSLFRSEPLDAEAQELIDGSPRVAIGIPNPFDRYVFVEPNSERLAELRALKAEVGSSRTIDILPMMASEGIDWLVKRRLSKATHRGVAFLDPFGAGLDWASVQKLADTGLFEVVVNFGLSMAIQRMLPNDGDVPAAWEARLDAYFGSRAWFEEVYQHRHGGLFAEQGLEKCPDYSERLLELYRARLKSAFGLVSRPRLIRNTRGAPLYYLLWAGANKKGLEGADYILSMGERLTKREFARVTR